MKRRNWTGLDQPLRARKPATWVMPDVFGPGWTDEKRDARFAVVAFCGKHLFELSTENPAAAMDYWTNPTLRLGVLPNLSIWSTIRDQSEADRIVPQLLACPAAVRGVRAVLRWPVNLTRVVLLQSDAPDRGKPPVTIDALRGWYGGAGDERSGIHRLRIAGETGRDAAPCDVQWIRSLAELAERSGMRPGVDVVVERLGGYFVGCGVEHWMRYRADSDRAGSDPAEWPDDLRRFAEKEQQA